MKTICFTLMILFYLQVNSLKASPLLSPEKVSFTPFDLFRLCSNFEESNMNTQKIPGTNFVCQLSDVQGPFASLFNGKRVIFIYEEGENKNQTMMKGILSKEYGNFISRMETRDHHLHQFAPISFSSPPSLQSSKSSITQKKNLQVNIGKTEIPGNCSKDKNDFQSLFAMILPVKNQSPNSLMVLFKPFSCQMWLVTAATFSYTTFIIWLMERHSNPEFGGSWKDQLANVLCFMFSCLFSSHDDRISRNYTRVVVLSWIFVAVILTQSYTTTFISMVNDPTRIMPDVMDIEWLKAKNAKVGFQVGFVVRPFVKEVLGFKTQNLKEITNIGDTLKKFKNKNISASFLELNLAKKFLHSTSGFVGLGFMNTHQVHDECITESGHTSYQPIIQVLSDNNILHRLHETWVAFPLLDYPILGNIQKDSADLQSFMPAFMFSWIVSTLSSILFLFCLVKETVKDFIIKMHIDILELTQCLVKYVKT